MTSFSLACTVTDLEPSASILLSEVSEGCRKFPVDDGEHGDILGGRGSGGECGPGCAAAEQGVEE